LSQEHVHSMQVAYISTKDRSNICLIKYCKFAVLKHLSERPRVGSRNRYIMCWSKSRDAPNARKSVSSKIPFSSAHNIWNQLQQVEQLNHASPDFRSSICWYLKWHCVQGLLSSPSQNVGWHAPFVFFDFVDALWDFFLAFCFSCWLALATFLSRLAATFSAWSSFFFSIVSCRLLFWAFSWLAVPPSALL